MQQNTVVQTGMITSKSKAAEIRAAFSNHIASGNAFVASIEPTKDGLYMRAMFVQQVNAQRPNTSGSTVELLALALDWNSSLRIKRAWQNFTIEKFQAANIQIGETAQAIFSRLSDKTYDKINIEVREDHVADTWAGGAQRPLINPQTNAPLSSGGNLVFEHTSLVIGQPNHRLLELDAATPVVAQAVVAPVVQQTVATPVMQTTM